MIAFATINNIFNQKNQASVYYDKNYTNVSFDYFLCIFIFNPSKQENKK